MRKHKSKPMPLNLAAVMLLSSGSPLMTACLSKFDLYRNNQNGKVDFVQFPIVKKLRSNRKGTYKMKIEKSCGAVVFTKENGKLQYLIIESKEGIFGFPKGHIEGNETEKETALREISEETGLTVELNEQFREEDSYWIHRKDEKILKQVVYFLAEYADQTPVAQETELNAIHLMDYETAMKAFQFESPKRILTRMNQYLVELL